MVTLFLLFLPLIALETMLLITNILMRQQDSGFSMQPNVYLYIMLHSQIDAQIRKITTKLHFCGCGLYKLCSLSSRRLTHTVTRLLMKVLEPERLKQGLIHINQLQVSLQEKFDNAHDCVPQMSGRNIPVLF